MRFTDELRIAAGSQWDRVVNHKFTNELAAGTIDRSLLKKYLIQDYRFLDAFVVLLSSIISKARSLQDRVPGCQFLAVITGAIDFRSFLFKLYSFSKKNMCNSLMISLTNVIL